jgi:hypothetical protein
MSRINRRKISINLNVRRSASSIHNLKSTENASRPTRREMKPRRTLAQQKPDGTRLAILKRRTECSSASNRSSKTPSKSEQRSPGRQTKIATDRTLVSLPTHEHEAIPHPHQQNAPIHSEKKSTGDTARHEGNRSNTRNASPNDRSKPLAKKKRNEVNRGGGGQDARHLLADQRRQPGCLAAVHRRRGSSAGFGTESGDLRTGRGGG